MKLLTEILGTPVTVGWGRQNPGAGRSLRTRIGLEWDCTDNRNKVCMSIIYIHIFIYIYTYVYILYILYIYMCIYVCNIYIRIMKSNGDGYRIRYKLDMFAYNYPLKNGLIVI